MDYHVVYIQDGKVAEFKMVETGTRYGNREIERL